MVKNPAVIASLIALDLMKLEERYLAILFEPTHATLESCLDLHKAVKQVRC